MRELTLKLQWETFKRGGLLESVVGRGYRSKILSWYKIGKTKTVWNGEKLKERKGKAR